MNKVGKLLTTANAKTIKGEKLGYKSYILYMNSYNNNSLGKNLCSHASKGCAESCLLGSGRGGMFDTVKNSRLNKTEFFLHNRVEFINRLDKEIASAIKSNKDKFIPVIRLNGTTDIAWEKFKVRDNKSLFELYPDIQFYDYTKNHLRFDKVLPKNYHLTFSRSETNHDKAMELLNRGFNVAMVFNKVPDNFQGYKVINADENDLRFLDDKGVICGLKYKRMTYKGADNKKAFDSGFAIAI